MQVMPVMVCVVSSYCQLRVRRGSYVNRNRLSGFQNKFDLVCIEASGGNLTPAKNLKKPCLAIKKGRSPKIYKGLPKRAIDGRSKCSPCVSSFWLLFAIASSLLDR